MGKDLILVIDCLILCSNLLCCFVCDGNIEKISRKETFNLKSFIRPLNELVQNRIMLVSKD